MFDPFWRLIGEARAVVAFHTGDSGYTKQTDEWEPFGNFRSFQFTPFRLLSSDRPVIDTMGALICHGVFERVPDVRVASIENGASWVAPLLKKLEKVYRTHSHEFAEDPVDTFRRHVYVSPFQEEDVDGFVDLMGAERVLFGSDFPHAEGLAEPLSYVNELANRDENEVRRIMCDNAWELIGRSAVPGRRS
jgi:predicted TIM-barrel fold metal-dependent hydrolase